MVRNWQKDSSELAKTVLEADLVIHLFRLLPILRRRYAIGFLEEGSEGGLRLKSAVMHDGLNSVVGILAQQLLRQTQALLVQVVAHVLTARLFTDDATEGGAVNAHQVAKHLTREVTLGV